MSGVWKRGTAEDINVSPHYRATPRLYSSLFGWKDLKLGLTLRVCCEFAASLRRISMVGPSSTE
jgi:hypothetical protein